MADEFIPVRAGFREAGDAPDSQSPALKILGGVPGAGVVRYIPTSINSRAGGQEAAVARLLKKLLFGPIPVVSSPRVQLYGALFLFGLGFLATLHAPQGFWDYIIRCATCPMALFLCLHAGISRGGLSFLERILCSLLLGLLLVLTPAFLWEAFHVKGFCDR